MMVDTIELLKKHEGLRLKPYYCTSGKITIGYGRNLEDRGITEDEADFLLGNDVIDCINQLRKHIPWFVYLSHNRQAVLINMCFNLGIQGLLKFKRTLKSIEEGLYTQASHQMLQSKWAKQVGLRALELSKIMREG